MDTLSMFRRLSLPILLYQLLLCHSAGGTGIQLVSNLDLEKPVTEETEMTLTCTDSRPATPHIDISGGLRILRKRVGGAIDGFEDMATVANVRQVYPGKLDISTTFAVSRKDEGAKFICGDAETLGFQSQAPTASLFLRVQFVPRSLILRSSPPGSMREEMVKVITCQTDEEGASPPINITWKHLSPLGALEALSEDMYVNQETILGAHGGSVTKSSLRIVAHRRLNGHRIECGIELPERMFLFRQTETLEVLFAPSSVRIHPSIEGGVKEGESLLLTCTVAAAHPPATIGWFEFVSIRSGGSDAGRDITDLAQVDMTPGEYSGMLVDSTLRISKTFRSNALTEYRCVVHQAALKKPVITEFKLDVLYPPTLEIVSMPADPAESQSVTLSCLTHGGSPIDRVTYSWWHAHTLGYPDSPLPQPLSKLNSISAKSIVSALNASLLADIFRHMKQIPDQSGRHFILDNLAKNHIGWYGCEVSNSGGTSRNLHLLLIDYAPKMKPNTKYVRHAQEGVATGISFTVDIRPAQAEFTWFWLGNDNALADKARQRILLQNLESRKNAPQDPIGGRTKRDAEKVLQPKAISPLVSPWVGRVRLEAVNSGMDEMQIALSFREVVSDDFGIYMCQLKHKAGQRDFYFELKPSSTITGIDPDSIKITTDGSMVRIAFAPPGTDFYTRIVLRICSHGTHSTKIPFTSSLAYLRRVDPESTSFPTSSSQAGAKDGLDPGNGGDSPGKPMNDCADYETSLAELGYLQLELERPITDYAFQLLVYQGTQLKQITRVVRWNTDKIVSASTITQKFFIQIIIGVLTTILLLCLLIFFIYYICSCLKRKNMKKKISDVNNGMIGGPRAYITLDGNKPFGSGPGSIAAELGSLQPLYPRQSVGSSCHSAKGFYGQPGISLAGSAHFPMHSDMRHSPSQNSQVSAITQRILSEVYLAAAKAASIAVSESIASGSINGVHIQSQLGPENVNYQRNSQYAESGSITGGSFSGIDGLPGYPGDAVGASLTRYAGHPETASQRSLTPGQRKSPNVRALSMTSSGAGVFQFGQRRPGNRNGLHNWSPPYPIFTPSATMRLNEAASALAAAAAEAVLEATQDPSLGAVDPRNMTRFGSMHHTQPTSSEDGESINSSKFFSRKAGGLEAGGKFGRKRQNHSESSALPNGGSDVMLPILTVAAPYIDNRSSNRAFDNSREEINFIPTSQTQLVAGGPWSRPNDVNDNISSKSSPYSDLAGEVNLSTFTNSQALPSSAENAANKQLDPTSGTLRPNGRVRESKTQPISVPT